jgi:hypothetical protein
MSIVLCLGFDISEIEKWLQKPKVSKVVVFDNSYENENRENFEKLYKQHILLDSNNCKKLTMYEGCIETNIEAYLKKEEAKISDYIYTGNMKMLYSCKKNNQDINNNQDEIHDSCL